MKTSTSTTKAKPTRAVKLTTPKPKAKPLTPKPNKEVKPTKPRRRPGLPLNLKVLYPNKGELQKAIFSGKGVQEAFRDHLLNKSGLFSWHGNKIDIVLPIPRRHRQQREGYCDNPGYLLIELAATFSNFFIKQVETTGLSSVVLEKEIGKGYAIIKGNKGVFIEAGVPEKSFDSMTQRLYRWLIMVFKAGIERVEKTKLPDLGSIIFLVYQRNTRLPNEQIYASIARLLKSLGLLAGPDQAIAERVKSGILKRRKENQLTENQMSVMVEKIISSFYPK
jgi:hypothetical protein